MPEILIEYYLFKKENSIECNCSDDDGDGDGGINSTFTF